MNVRYYRHKEKHTVICEEMYGYLRFGKWVWKGNTCFEEYKFKDFTKEFLMSFEQITQKEFNIIWGNKLEQIKGTLNKDLKIK